MRRADGPAAPSDAATVEVVAFDLMDTLVHDPFREALAAGLGPRWRELLATRDPSAWPRFETGELTEEEFWATHGGAAVDVDAFERVRRDGTTWLPGMLELLTAVRNAGIPVVIATNYPCWIDDLQARLLDGRVDEVVASCRIGARKPAEAFYDEVVAAAGRLVPNDAAPASIVFVDDREDNVVGARRAGLHGLRFEGADALCARLRALGVTV